MTRKNEFHTLHSLRVSVKCLERESEKFARCEEASSVILLLSTPAALSIRATSENLLDERQIRWSISLDKMCVECLARSHIVTIF